MGRDLNVNNVKSSKHVTKNNKAEMLLGKCDNIHLQVGWVTKMVIQNVVKEKLVHSSDMASM